MAVRTGLQPRRRRMGLGDLEKGLPLKRMERHESEKERIEKLRKIVDEGVKRAMLPSDTKEFKKKLGQAIRQGVSQGASEKGVKIKFKKRRKELILKELK